MDEVDTSCYKMDEMLNEMDNMDLLLEIKNLIKEEQESLDPRVSIRVIIDHYINLDVLIRKFR